MSLSKPHISVFLICSTDDVSVSCQLTISRSVLTFESLGDLFCWYFCELPTDHLCLFLTTFEDLPTPWLPVPIGAKLYAHPFAFICLHFYSYSFLTWLGKCGPEPNLTLKSPIKTSIQLFSLSEPVQALASTTTHFPHYYDQERHQ